jgi:hypothetical protein
VGKLLSVKVWLTVWEKLFGPSTVTVAPTGTLFKLTVSEPVAAGGGGTTPPPPLLPPQAAITAVIAIVAIRAIRLLKAGINKNLSLLKGIRPS